jgi:hypothetical protein
MAAYSAYLISSLAVQHEHLPVRDLQGLLSDGSYKLGVLKYTYRFNIFDVCEMNYFWLYYLVVVGLGIMNEAGKVWKLAYQTWFIG